jgi:hypothetical protein
MKSSLFLQDERELKRERRKQSNRESARRSRLRKQVVLESVHPHFLQNGMVKNIQTHAHTRTCSLVPVNLVKICLQDNSRQVG